MFKTKLMIAASAAFAVILVAGPLLKDSQAQSLRISGPRGFAGPFPEDIRSFPIELTDTNTLNVLIPTSGGHESRFVITDVFLDVTSQTGEELIITRLLQLGNPTSILGQVGVTLLLADAGTINSTATGILAWGSKSLHFESGIVVDTSLGSGLALSKFTGSGTVTGVVSGYFSGP